MPVLFNSLLAQFGLPPETVILLRHQDKRSARGRTPYELWRDDRPAFEVYQSCQTFENRSKFSRASSWASFVANHDSATMFAGLYAVKYKGVLTKDTPQPHREGIDLAATRLQGVADSRTRGQCACLSLVVRSARHTVP